MYLGVISMLWLMAKKLGKFYSKYNEEIFLGYSNINKTYKILNNKTLIIRKSKHVVFD